MSVHRAVAATALLLGVLATAACTSSSTSCSGGACTISTSGGEQTVDVEIGAVERDLRIGPIEPGAVTLSVRGEQARLAPGESARIGGLQVQVTTVEGTDVALEVRTG